MYEQFLEAFSIWNRDRLGCFRRSWRGDRHFGPVTHVENAHKIG